MGILRQLINALDNQNNSPALMNSAASPTVADARDEVVKLAEKIASAISESLRISNSSTEVSTRISELNKARDSLADLKNLAAQYSYLEIEHLNAVETTISAIEAETRTLASNELTNTVQVAKPHLSASDEQAILMCIQSCFRVVNESIEIARKSKNIETKLSRLDVAKNRLKEAQRQANQFSLKVDGFDEAEAEINRIGEAIRNGTPTEIAEMSHIEIIDPFASPARDLLKEATALKKEKKFIEACDKLHEAYLADGAEDLMIEDRLRLPMYLQLAGKNEDGWDELNRLLAKYNDQFSQPTIANQMRVFLQKEGKAKKAVLYGIWTLCKVIEANNKNLDSCYRLADSKERLILDSEPVVGQTPNGNPIYDSSYQFFVDRVNKQFTREEIESHITPLLKKAKLDQLLDSLSSDLREYLLSNKSYDIKDIQIICEKFIAE